MTNAEAKAIQRILGPIPFPTICEVGAYASEDFESLLGRDVVHVIVEPDSRNWPMIPLGPRRRILKCAIAKHTGWRDFWFSDGETGSGSILRPTSHLDIFKHITFRKSDQKMPCYSLDDLYKITRLEHVDLLWADIQGAEAEMIEGGGYALSRTHYLFMEAEEVEFYAGQKVRPDLLQMLPDWKLIETLDYNVLLENTKFDV